MENFYIRELDAEKDTELLFDIVAHENIVFGEASVGNWNIKPFAKYGKVFAMLYKEEEKETLVSVIEVLRNVEVSAVPKYEKQGHTRKLLEYVINYLLKNNIDIIELTVSENNERAINMYLKSRFKIVKKLKNEYGNDGQRYLMRYTKNTK